MVVDKVSQQPIEYANIGIFEKGVGTVCNTMGIFTLTIPAGLEHQSLLISHLGYTNQVIRINGGFNDLKIELEPVSLELKEVTIHAGEKTEIGYRPTDDAAKGFFTAKGLGLEGGTFIKNKDTILLTTFNFNILQIPFDSLRFRLNFYSIKKNKPAEKINLQDIVFTLLKKDLGIFSLALSPYKIQVSGDFICTFELVELFGQSAENAQFLFSAIPDKEGYIPRKEISHGKWSTVKNYSLCFWFTGKK
jgi:hypothetical protein